MSQPVVLKSNPHGINLILDDRIPFQELLDEILHKFKESDKFFKNARIALSFEGRELSQEEELAIVDLISRNTSIDVVCILDNNSLRMKSVPERFRNLMKASLEEPVNSIREHCEVDKSSNVRQALLYLAM